MVENIKNIHEGINELRFSPQPRITLEVLLVTLCSLNMQKNHKALMERIELLEEKIKNGVTGRAAVARAERTVENNISQKQDDAVDFDSNYVSDMVEEIIIEPENVRQEDFVGDSNNIWESLLNELANSGKMSILACVKQGKLIIIENNQAIIEFSTVFLKERTEKDDYREIIEGIINKICGQDVKIKCVLPGEIVERRTEKNNFVIEQKIDKEHPSLKAAIKMFGDNVIAED